MPRTLTQVTDATDIHVGRRVRAERNRCGLSQTTLGQAIGVTFQQVQKYERGSNRISASMLMRIARTLGCLSLTYSLPIGKHHRPQMPQSARLKAAPNSLSAMRR